MSIAFNPNFMNVVWKFIESQKLLSRDSPLAKCLMKLRGKVELEDLPVFNALSALVSTNANTELELGTMTSG